MAGGTRGQSFRRHVHLVEELPWQGAISGMRSDCDIAIWVKTREAAAAGVKFYQSANAVLLTETTIDPAFFHSIQIMRSTEVLTADGGPPNPQQVALAIFRASDSRSSERYMASHPTVRHHALPSAHVVSLPLYTSCRRWETDLASHDPGLIESRLHSLIPCLSDDSPSCTQQLLAPDWKEAGVQHYPKYHCYCLCRCRGRQRTSCHHGSYNRNPRNSPVRGHRPQLDDPKQSKAVHCPKCKRMHSIYSRPKKFNRKTQRRRRKWPRRTTRCIRRRLLAKRLAQRLSKYLLAFVVLPHCEPLDKSHK